MKITLGRQSILLLGVNGLFALAGALSGTFLNVFLWKSRPDYAMLGWFTLSQQLAIGLTFWLAGKWVKEHNKMSALRLGTALSGIFYMIVLWAGSKAVDWIWPLGMLLGCSLGLFWIAFNVVYFEITDRANRDLFNGWVGLLGSMTGIIGPWFSGLIITRMTDNTGYRLIFTVSLVIYVIAVVFSFFLKKRKVSGTYRWSEPWIQLSKRDSPWRTLGLGLFAQGAREGVFAFLIALLVYLATAQEYKLGQFSLITSAVALVSYWAAGKWFKPQYRSKGMFIGALILLVVLLPLLWKVTYGTLLIMGIGSAVAMPLYVLPMISAGFDMMGTSGENVEKRVELVVLRELCLMLGRLCGLTIFIVTVLNAPSLRMLTWLIIVLGASPLIGWIFMRKLLNRTEGQEPSA
ncbi:MFS transporter [Paenibacillus sp. FSL H7-0942]|uniref:MFS transporter n=1 Tax=unclassified Paenibacillus TaxID=185978 RepID=UPI0003E20F8D|nr:MFS transporter [Paenibacillus sp. FSL R5-192]ETT36632.1 Permease of the major facilitator superfamily protein [Paenibacillus sp. FSL R5-192]